MTGIGPERSKPLAVRHTVVISDIHLCELERSSGLWMRYRQEPYGPDQEIQKMLAALRERVRGDDLTLVLNGDIFDFDAPRVLGNDSVFHDLPRSAEHTVPMLGSVLDDHPIIVEALGEVLAEGHTVVFIAGNHDVQLTLPEVREVLTARLVEAAVRVAPEGSSREGLRARVLHRAWFHRTEDGIVIEHGNQYDSYCSYRYPMEPFGKEPRVIQPTMGSLASRHLTSRMGFFNPHVDGSYMLSALGYARHWASCYLFSRHSLVVAWFVGAVRTVLELFRVREPASRARQRANIEAAMRETGVAFLRVARHARLCARPAEDLLGRVLRELWLDRVALLALTVVLAAGWMLWARGLAVVGVALIPAIFLIYELLVPKPTIDATWATVQSAARRVAKVHRAAAVVFGHTHRPEGQWEGGVFFGNSGSWSAAYKDIACTVPLDRYRPLVWLQSRGGKLAGGLMRWAEGRFEPSTSPGQGAAIHPLQEG
jgi:UDP-2,3-diacylglucosamine pyrophosphatase LpxH